MRRVNYDSTELPDIKISGKVELLAVIVAKASPIQNIVLRIIILPNLGSIGSRANIRPSGVNSSFESKHLISDQIKRKIF